MTVVVSLLYRVMVQLSTNSPVKLSTAVPIISYPVSWPCMDKLISTRVKIKIVFFIIVIVLILFRKVTQSNGFFQINLPVYELALKEIAKHITSADVLDLYSGVGTIGLSVAGGRRLTLVESDKSAYAELEINAASFPSTTPIYDKSENALDYIKENQTVILDPPRAGCSEKMIKELLRIKPQRLVYVSCDPATLGRDIKIFAGFGYQAVRACAVDMFPGTRHVESVVLLTKQEQ